MVKISTSTPSICCDISLSVYSKLIPNFQSSMLHCCSNFLFYPALSLLKIFIGIFMSFHFWKNSQVSLTIPFFIAYKGIHFKQVNVSTIIHKLSFAMVVTFNEFGSLKVVISISNISLDTFLF